MNNFRDRSGRVMFRIERSRRASVLFPDDEGPDSPMMRVRTGELGFSMAAGVAENISHLLWIDKAQCLSSWRRSHPLVVGCRLSKRTSKPVFSNGASESGDNSP